MRPIDDSHTISTFHSLFTEMLESANWKAVPPYRYRSSVVRIIYYAKGYPALKLFPEFGRRLKQLLHWVYAGSGNMDMEIPACHGVFVVQKQGDER